MERRAEEGLAIMQSCSSRPDTPHQRLEESRIKIAKAIDEVIGSRKEEMFYVSAIATSPAQQGHGYGSALIKMVTTLVSSLHCTESIVDLRTHLLG